MQHVNKNMRYNYVEAYILQDTCEINIENTIKMPVSASRRIFRKKITKPAKSPLVIYRVASKCTHMFIRITMNSNVHSLRCKPTLLKLNQIT